MSNNSSLLLKLLNQLIPGTNMSEIRHPEKVKNKESEVLPKPKWIRSRIPSSDTFKSTKEIIKKRKCCNSL